MFSSVMDPIEIQNRFSTEMADEGFITIESDNLSFSFEDFKPFLCKIPQREIDLIEMYYREDKKQKEIADFFGVTQGAISHRLSRAKKRLEFLRDMPKLSDHPKVLLKKYFTDFECDLFICMVETTCQSKTADILNKKHNLKDKDRMTQIKVRHKFDRYIDKLKELKKKNPYLIDCYELARYIKNNLYMLHEVNLPHFNRGFRVRYKLD